MVAVDALVAGLNVVDILVRLPAKVTHGEKHEVTDLVVAGGGPASNAACVLGMLGWKTGFLTRLGENTLSAIARAEFARCGVGDAYFIADATASPVVAVVEIDPETGDRTVFYSLANYHRLTRADVPVDAVKRAKLILVDGYEAEAALAMLQAAHGTGCRSVLDIEAGDAAAMREVLGLGTDIILPLAAALQLSGEKDAEAALRKLAAWTKGQLLATDGVNGSWALTAAGVIHQPAFVVKAVDTTGCGDAYHAAYASGVLHGWPLELRMEFGAWVASRVALALGGRGNLPTLESLQGADLSAISGALRGALRR